MREVILLMQVMLLLLQGIIYFFSPIGSISFFVVNFSALSVIISFILSWRFRNSTILKGKGFSIILFFTLMSWIVSFQVPLEIVYGNDELLDTSLRLIYDASIVNKLVAFSSLMLNFFLMGTSYSYLKYNSVLKSSNINGKSNTIIISYPLLVLTVISFIIFFATVNSDYINSGHGVVELNPMSATAIGFLVKFSAVYLSIKLFYLQDKKLNLINYFSHLNVYYVSFTIIAVLAFFIANNRVYPIMILTPFLFSIFIHYKKKVNTIIMLLIFFALSIFGTLFKVYGFSDVFSSGLYIDEAYIITKFYFPFTAELAGSIYSNTILYSIWENSEFSLYGASFLVGLARTIPGIMGLLNINPIAYDSAIIATLYSNTSYGVGTTSIVDSLINFGVPISLVLFYVLGLFFSRSEMRVYNNNISVKSYIIYLTITILILFYPRASLNDLLGMLLFNIIFFKFYNTFFKRQS